MTISKIHPLQKFEIRTIHRSQIKEAPYNPRSIEDEASRMLGKNIETKGLLDTLVWNEQTGNLVSGHQRIKKLDKYAQKKLKSLDYEITVAIVQLTLQEEIEQNIFFNNTRGQGYFDDDLMIELLKNTELGQINFEAAGLTEDDLSIFGIEIDMGKIENHDVDKMVADFEKIKQENKAAISPEEYEAKKEAVKAKKKDIMKNEVDTYFTISFSNQKDKQNFLISIGEQPTATIIKGEPFVKKYFSE